MSNVVSLSGQTIGEGLSLEPDAVLEGAKGQCEAVVVIGRRADGSVYVASSGGQPEALAEIEVARHWMLTQIAAVRGWG